MSTKMQQQIIEWRMSYGIYLNEDILFEYLRYMAGSNEVIKHLWKIVQNEQNAKDNDDPGG